MDRLFYTVFGLILLPLVLSHAGTVYAQAAAVQAPALQQVDPAVFCQFATGAQNGQCISCMSGGNRIWTGIGCVGTTTSSVFYKVFTFGIGLAGGIAFLLIIIGGLQILTSAGNPEQLNAGRELVGAAITGLILIVFSVFLLRLIGYDIMRLPGFGGA